MCACSTMGVDIRSSKITSDSFQPCSTSPVRIFRCDARLVSPWILADSGFIASSGSKKAGNGS